MPPSVNASHALTEGRFNPKTRKYTRAKVRSTEYTAWVESANRFYNQQFPTGVLDFKGRIHINYAFCFNDKQFTLSDVDNRIKCLQDFFQHKFFLNDNQVDSFYPKKFYTLQKSSYVIARIFEVEDKRYGDPNEFINP